ncbi:hypothetical protein E3N88_01038 [Mikania micrantha]|uniref:GYF domain-containing protein n=1 Tax=Mikania micrantha TaxID=192012 RepID=A0A5N6Q057_9ASTR|nr:hypothetical protein E3N88_01038 [Mikania micrantha]
MSTMASESQGLFESLQPDAEVQLIKSWIENYSCANMEKGDGKGSFYWVGEFNDQTLNPVKHRRKIKSKKLEFVGWGSKPLIEFLQSIGKDTGKELSQHNVAAIINDYVHNFNLLHPVKKKRVVCDERLYSLFGKKSIPRIKIHELLNEHFADNHDSSEDDHLNSSEEYEDVNVTGKKRKVFNSDEKAPVQKKKTSETRLSHFAAIISENIKLLYLKRSLVQELVKQPESFEGKLLGSYIRIKSDPMDFSQKNLHQLHPVTGVKNVSGNGGLPEEVLLQVPNVIKDIPICMLSDDGFSKEEVDDLCQRAKDGLLKRPTVVEVEQKARILHEDITKHWIPRELAYLQNLIDRANDKGWRKEYPSSFWETLICSITLFEYLEKKKRLQTPSEQSKLLTEVPKVIADKLEPESTTSQEQLQDIQQPNDSPILIQKDVSRPTNDLVADQAIPSNGSYVEEAQLVVIDRFDKGQTETTKNTGSEEHFISFQWVEDKQMPKTIGLGQTVDLSNVIELSDDEEETHEQVVEVKTNDKEDEYECTRPKWFYVDPQGQTQGPFSRTDLKRWSDAGYFSPDFKVWRDGQTPDCAILLTDMLSRCSSKG